MGRVMPLPKSICTYPFFFNFSYPYPLLMGEFFRFEYSSHSYALLYSYTIVIACFGLSPKIFVCSVELGLVQPVLQR